MTFGEATFQVNVWEEGGSDLNVQLTLRGEKVNRLTALYWVMPLLEPNITPPPHFPFAHVELDTTTVTLREAEEHGSLVRSPSWLEDGLVWN